MTRLLSAAAALAASTVALTAAAGPARAQAAHAPFYVATPEAAPAAARVMTRTTGWTVRDGRYLAARAPERAALLCDLLARDVGRLSSFSAGGTAFDADDLAKCNARAKAAPATAVAAR